MKFKPVNQWKRYRTSRSWDPSVFHGTLMSSIFLAMFIWLLSVDERGLFWAVLAGIPWLGRFSFSRSRWSCIYSQATGSGPRELS